MTIRPGRKESPPAILAAGTHDFVVFQVVHKIIGFRNSGKAYRTEFFESIVYFFYLAHLLSPNSLFLVRCSAVQKKAEVKAFEANVPV
jgi:hypothetical protein